MASFCFAWWILYIISNPFNCSDTARRVAKAMIGAKVITQLRFAIFCFVFLINSRQNSSPGSSAFSHLGNRAEFSHMNPRRNSSRASPVNRAHMKRPSVAFYFGVLVFFLIWLNCVVAVFKQQIRKQILRKNLLNLFVFKLDFSRLLEGKFTILKIFLGTWSWATTGAHTWAHTNKVELTASVFPLKILKLFYGNCVSYTK